MLLRIFALLVLGCAIFGGAWFIVHELYIRPEERLKSDRILPPPTPPPDPSLAEFQKFLDVRRTKTAAEARVLIEQFLREFPSSTKRDAAHDILGEINSSEFFAARPNEGNVYVVQKGDSISRVAARTKVPVELLIYLNRIEARYLQPNQRLVAPACSFRLVINQKARRVVLFNGDKFFRQYPAAVWPGADRKPAILPKQTGRVIEKRAFDQTGSITPSQFRYFQAYHIVLVSIPGHSLHTQPDDPKAVVERPPGGGIGMAPAHMNEIAVLLPAGAPVSME